MVSQLAKPNLKGSRRQKIKGSLQGDLGKEGHTGGQTIIPKTVEKHREDCNRDETLAFGPIEEVKIIWGLTIDRKYRKRK